MNERIKELIKQATVWEGMENGYIFDKEKFAKLIILECADFVAINTLEDQNMWGKIMEHFEIEL